MPNPEAPAIVTDSTCDIPLPIVEKLKIDIVRAKIMFGEDQFTDGEDIDMTGFLARLQDPKIPHPKTSSPGPEPFKPIYRAHEGPILSVHVADILSGFLNHGVIAAKDLGRTNITPYDSTSTSLGLGFMVMEAARLSAEGHPTEEILPILDSMRKRTYIIALADTLKYLRESGRIDPVRERLGSMLDVKPIIQIKDSTATTVDQVRTRSKAIPTFIQWIQKHAPFDRVGIVHAGNEDLAMEIAYILGNDFPQDEIIINGLTPSLSAHIGPGAVGVAFVEKAR